MSRPRTQWFRIHKGTRADLHIDLTKRGGATLRNTQESCLPIFPPAVRINELEPRHRGPTVFAAVKTERKLKPVAIASENLGQGPKMPRPLHGSSGTSVYLCEDVSGNLRMRLSPANRDRCIPATRHLRSGRILSGRFDSAQYPPTFDKGYLAV